MEYSAHVHIALPISLYLLLCKQSILCLHSIDRYRPFYAFFKVIDSKNNDSTQRGLKIEKCANIWTSFKLKANIIECVAVFCNDVLYIFHIYITCVATTPESIIFTLELFLFSFFFSVFFLKECNAFNRLQFEVNVMLSIRFILLNSLKIYILFNAPGEK